MITINENVNITDHIRLSNMTITSQFADMTSWSTSCDIAVFLLLS